MATSGSDDPVGAKAPAGAIGRILLEEDEIVARVAQLGRTITHDYAGKELLLVGVLRGAWVFMADLSREIDLPVQVDFMAVSSYGNSTTSSGVVRILKDLDEDLTGRHVLIVEDIIDSGLTISYLRRNLRNRQAASVEVCALLVREGRQQVEEGFKYVGFAIPPDFVVGYGLDVSGNYRNLKFIAQYAGEESNDDAP